MGRPGVIAFPVLLVLGAITGYLTYDMLVVQSTPVEGVYEGSPYRKDLPAAQNQNSAPAQSNTSGQQPVEEDPTTDEESSVVTILILKGSSVSGAPDYDPDHATVPLSATIRWVNEDSLPHSATSGTGVTDADFGSSFDTGLFTAGEKSIAASEIGAGEYTYFCIAHPFMVGTLTIE
jgi:plastocyanin